MAKVGIGYISGVVAVKEKYLLKDKLARLCELGAEDAFRALTESGYGSMETAASVYEYEKLIAAEEKNLDEFVREYSPSKAEAAYLLSPRDFHNAKALMKAAYLGTSAEKMLAPEGLISIDTLSDCVKNGNFSPLLNVNPILKEACEQAAELLQTEPSGAKMGDVFEKALYTYLKEAVKRNSVLKKLLIAKTDMTNILTALRCVDEQEAEEKYLPTGSVNVATLNTLFDGGKAREAFAKTPYADFVDVCLFAKEKGLPLTEAERIRDGYDVFFLAQRKYELEKSEPFLYYVFRRKIENANVRIVFVCLLAGLSEQEIKKRLRAF